VKTLKEIIMERLKEQSAFPFYSKNSKNFKDNMKGVDAEYLLSNSVKVVSKAGKQQLEITKDGHIGVTDGWKSVWITVYSDGKWASDTPEFINKGIKDFLDRNASRVDDLANNFRGKNSVKEAVTPNYFYVSHNIQLATLPGKVLVETPKAQKSFSDFGTAMTWIQGLDGDYNTKEIHDAYYNRSIPEKEPNLYESSKEGDYMLLSRLQMDCKYVINNADKATSKKGLEKHLWAGNVKDQIAKMKELYNSFSEEEKPEWISMEDINSYEKKLNSIFSSLKEAKLELWDEVNLATHWLSALVNGDSSGLSDEEEEQLDKWEAKLPKGYTIDYGDLEDTDFKIDVVSGLRATTVRVKIYTQGK
jgi:hypothetical protein